MIEERGIRLDLEQEDEPDKDSDVFYNDDQRLNRDISVAALQTFVNGHEHEVDALDAQAASGIRAMRYRTEVDGLGTVTANDINPTAVENIRTNLETNGIENIEITEEDANLLMTERRKQHEFIDIDPFGSPIRFQDSAVRSLSHDAFAGFTATDLATLCGSYRKTCRRRYGAWSLNTSYCHETGLRILIRSLFDAFARFDKVFRPKITFAQKHYYRVLGEVYESKKGVNRSLDNLGYLRHCDACKYRELLEEPIKDACPLCDSHLHVLGPLWIGKLGRRKFIRDAMDDLKERGYEESHAFLGTLHDECLLKTPFYDLHNLAANVGLPVPSHQDVIAALEETGYNVARTHFAPTGIKTAAPIEDLKDVIRELNG